MDEVDSRWSGLPALGGGEGVHRPYGSIQSSGRHNSPARLPYLPCQASDYPADFSFSFYGGEIVITPDIRRGTHVCAD